MLQHWQRNLLFCDRNLCKLIFGHILLLHTSKQKQQYLLKHCGTINNQYKKYCCHIDLEILSNNFMKINQWPHFLFLNTSKKMKQYLHCEFFNFHNGLIYFYLYLIIFKRPNILSRGVISRICMMGHLHIIQIMEIFGGPEFSIKVGRLCRQQMHFVIHPNRLV